MIRIMTTYDLTSLSNADVRYKKNGQPSITDLYKSNKQSTTDQITNDQSPQGWKSHLYLSPDDTLNDGSIGGLVGLEIRRDLISNINADSIFTDLHGAFLAASPLILEALVSSERAATRVVNTYGGVRTEVEIRLIDTVTRANKTGLNVQRFLPSTIIDAMMGSPYTNIVIPDRKIEEMKRILSAGLIHIPKLIEKNGKTELIGIPFLLKPSSYRFGGNRILAAEYPFVIPGRQLNMSNMLFGIQARSPRDVIDDSNISPLHKTLYVTIFDENNAETNILLVPEDSTFRLHVYKEGKHISFGLEDPRVWMLLPMFFAQGAGTDLSRQSLDTLPFSRLFALDGVEFSEVNGPRFTTMMQIGLQDLVIPENLKGIMSKYREDLLDLPQNITGFSQPLLDKHVLFREELLNVMNAQMIEPDRYREIMESLWPHVLRKFSTPPRFIDGATLSFVVIEALRKDNPDTTYMNYVQKLLNAAADMRLAQVQQLRYGGQQIVDIHDSSSPAVLTRRRETLVFIRECEQEGFYNMEDVLNNGVPIDIISRYIKLVVANKQKLATLGFDISSQDNLIALWTKVKSDKSPKSTQVQKLEVAFEKMIIQQVNNNLRREITNLANGLYQRHPRLVAGVSGFLFLSVLGLVLTFSKPTEVTVKPIDGSPEPTPTGIGLALPQLPEAMSGFIQEQLKPTQEPGSAGAVSKQIQEIFKTVEPQPLVGEETIVLPPGTVVFLLDNDGSVRPIDLIPNQPDGSSVLVALTTKGLPVQAAHANDGTRYTVFVPQKDEKGRNFVWQGRGVGDSGPLYLNGEVQSGQKVVVVTKQGN